MKKKWVKSDQPFDSEHLDMGHCGARVKPDRHSGGWEWSIWLGPAGRRVLHGQGTRASKSAAKKIAAEACAHVRR